MANAYRDENNVPTIIGVSSADGVTPVRWKIDPITGRGLVDLPTSGGTVTSVSVVTANGFAGTVATATTTPAITLSTTITGILKGNGTAISAASAGTDYQAAGNYITALTGDVTASGPGSVAATLATVNSNVGTFGSATQSSVITVNGKGLITAASSTTVIPAVGSITGLGTGVATWLATPSSANLIAAVTDETGSGSLVFSTSPSLTTPNIGVATGTNVLLTANAITASSNAATVPVTSGRNIVTNNSAATLTITLTTSGAINMQSCIVQVLDFSAVAQTLTFVNTENSTVSVPATTNGSTTLPLSVGFIYNSATSKWRCVASA